MIVFTITDKGAMKHRIEYRGFTITAWAQQVRGSQKWAAEHRLEQYLIAHPWVGRYHGPKQLF